MPTRELPAAQYRALLASTGILVWRAGLDAKCDWFNETWLAFTGRAFEDELGDGWLAGVHAEDRERCVATYLESFSQRRAFAMHYRLRRYDGVYRWLLDRGVPYEDDAGRFAGFIGSCVDVDDQRKLEQAKATFLNLMAHELRTPLTPMLAYAHMFRSYSDKGQPPPAELANKLDAQVTRLVRSIDHLGDAGRLQLGRPFRIERAGHDVVNIVAGAVREIAAQLRPANVSFTPPAAPVIANVDPSELGKAIRHLVDNGIKFSARGSEVAVALTSDEQTVTITVSDQGIGIPAGELSEVMHMFYRASNAPSERFQGVGVGLAVVRQIVDQHGGELHVASNGIGTGTSVTIKIPRA